VKIALASLDQAWEDKAANLRRCAELCATAAAWGADFIVFPEMTLTGFTMRAAAVVETQDHAPTIDAFKDLAREHNLHVAFGVVLEGEDRPLNTLVVVGRAGNELARYAKIHPFSFADEHKHFDAGDALACARVARVTFGLTVCYDLRFPELFASLAHDCEAMLVIANWPERRIEHWHALLRARAIDCQAFVVGVNRTGTDENGIVYPRSSQAFGPLGDRLHAEQSSGELDLFTLDPAVVTRYRRAFPILRDRRPDLYPRLSSPATDRSRD
jgi:predicted amidohydrolase